MDSPVVSAAEMRAVEKAAFARGISAESLMDQAAAGIARAVTKFFPAPGRCLVFAGKGNNAGDAFAAAKILQTQGWEIETRLAFPESDLGELARRKFDALRLARKATASAPRDSLIILDGLLGLGAKPPLRAPIKNRCREINQLRRTENAFVFALDLPTGLDGDSGASDRDCVIADFTITIGYAKAGLLADDAANLVGRLEVIALPDFAAKTKRALVASAGAMRGLLPRRPFDSHKNQFGRVGILAGSKGFTGAAIMSSLGALRGGAGLVELFVPEEIYPIVATSAAPEVMVKPIRDYGSLHQEKIDVWAVGPGLGRARDAEIRRFLAQVKQPTVIDADALNALAEEMKILKRPAGPRLLTPHPGEMQRLFPSKKEARVRIAQSFCARYPVTLLLKGSRTLVAEKSAPLSYNTTGNPGMSTGGMGDVLTGVCAALLAQKLSPFQAAQLGAWVCGRAAELAIFNYQASEQSLLPTDVLAHLGQAFRELNSESVS